LIHVKFITSEYPLGVGWVPKGSHTEEHTFRKNFLWALSALQPPCLTKDLLEWKVQKFLGPVGLEPPSPDSRAQNSVPKATELVRVRSGEM
jgi:hypothetical protein